MSEASDRGKQYEIRIQKITARTLGLEVKRDPRSGGGDWHKEDIRDRYGTLPLSIEVKNQATIKLKEWWKDARDKASMGQAAVVVFPADAEDLCIMRYSDLLNIVKEMFDWRETAEAHTAPRNSTDPYRFAKVAGENAAEVFDAVINSPHVIKTKEEAVASAMAAVAKIDGLRYCPNGHVVPEGRARCMGKNCQYSATFKKPKENKR